MPLNNLGRLSRISSCVFLFSLVLNLAHADVSIWDYFRGGKGLFSDDSGQVCVGLDQATRGVCMTRRNCGKQGGNVVGYCGVASTCCSLTTCGYAISSKEAILNMPNVGRNFPGLECSYNIVPRSRRVTQIRIDLEILTLSQPTTDNNDWNGNGGWNNEGNNGNNNNGNGGWNNGNNGGWNNNGNSDGWNNNNGGSNNEGNNGNGGWNNRKNDRYRRAVVEGEIESDYDEETFFRNGGLGDVVLTRGSFGEEYDDGLNAEVVNHEDYNTWNSDKFRTTSTSTTTTPDPTSTSSTTTTTTPAPTSTTTTTTPDPISTTTTITPDPTSTTTTTTTTTPDPTSTTTTTTPAPTSTTSTTTSDPTSTTTTITPDPTSTTTTTTTTIPDPTSTTTTTTPDPTSTTSTTTTTTPAPTSTTTTTTPDPTSTTTTSTTITPGPVSTTTTASTTTSTTTITTPTPATTKGTTPRPNPDNNGHHGNNGGGWGNGHGNENDQPQEYKCRHDVLEVTNYVDSRSIIPHLCGENSGQHFYFSLDSFKSSGIRITLKIADRQHNDNLATPNWRIRIRQIEDRGRRNARDLDNFNRRDEIINTGVGGLFAAVSGRSLSSDIDEQLLAPAGCLQYYPERTGTIESFNYNSGKGPYLPNLRYAICFKRTSSVCGVKLMARKFQLSNLRNNNNEVDSDCEAPGRDNRRGDYLLIPDGVSKLGRRGTKWCGNSAQHSVVAFTSPGPLYMFFNSDKYTSRNDREIGFKMSFAVLNNC